MDFRVQLKKSLALFCIIWYNRSNATYEVKNAY